MTASLATPGPEAAAEPGRLEFGIVLREEDFRDRGARLAALTELIAAAGLDRVTVGDHVSFAGGHGADGLIQATALLAAHDSLPVQTGVYLLALRHPAVVARQLATLALIAPGRFTFGVGVGGDDPAELRLCGIEPRSRGARTSEALALVRQLLSGEETNFSGRFFEISGAAIRPAPVEPIPVLVGGRSDAALARAGTLGDGWLALWVSPERFRAGTASVDAAAARCGRSPRRFRHTLQLWAAFGESRERARSRIAPVLERAYGLAFERFERYTPCGRPEDVAAALEPYLTAGARRFNVVPVAGDLESAVAAIAECKRLLAASVAAPDTRPAAGRCSPAGGGTGRRRSR